MRATRAEVDLAAVRHNVALLARHVAPSALCAVVKADGYGHGAIAVSEAALQAGASWLAVALVEEAAVLRRAGIDAPVLLLSEPRGADVRAAVRLGLRVAVYTPECLTEVGAASQAEGVLTPVHVKVNTGMNRVGASPDDVVGLVERAGRTPGVEVEALWTHCAVADEPGNDFTAVQLRRFADAVGRLEARAARPPLLHAANSAAALDHPASRLDLVRAGIATYGIAPAPALAGRLDLRPALSLRSELAFVKPVRAGEGVSYGLRHTFERATRVGTVPIGYADGVPRALALHGGVVLVGGERRPIVGVVTMDQLMVDLGPEAPWRAGEEVVLLGQQGDEAITADEWAEAVGTIAYEIVCGIGPRVPRWYTG